MSQWLPTTSEVPPRGSAPAGPFREWRRLAMGLGLALVGLALSGLGTHLRAQSRGTLQVATQVLPARPSQLALVQGLAMARALPGPLEASLAVIQVDRVVGDVERFGVVRRARTVVTLSFLRN